MAHGSRTLGVDFGTSNSAAGYLQAGKPHLVEMAPGQNTLPTTFFFDFETRQTLIGEPANQALLRGAEGRFMRALKRVLGTSLMREERQILNERVTFIDIIGRFLQQVKIRAEGAAGASFDGVLSGRPVVFHGLDDPREEQALADLRACYEFAGFRDVSFLAEPEAAALANGALDGHGDIGLIVDVGGGTSDFSLFESTNSGLRILANHGVRIGGTDFDRAISIASVMPELGKGTHLHKTMGPGTLPVPNAVFNDLATWELIPFLYTGRIRRDVQDMLKVAEQPKKLGRLASVLEHELGHDIAFSVERGKIAANSNDHDARIDLDVVERNLSVPFGANMLARSLSQFADGLLEGARHALDMAGLQAGQVDRVIYVGGSSLMSSVSTAIKAAFPHACHARANVFTAVADGLAIAAGNLGQRP